MTVAPCVFVRPLNFSLQWVSALDLLDHDTREFTIVIIYICSSKMSGILKMFFLVQKWNLRCAKCRMRICAGKCSQLPRIVVWDFFF